MPLTYCSTSSNTTSITSDFLQSDQSGSASSKSASDFTTTVYRFAKCVRPSTKTLLHQVQLGSPTSRPPIQNATPWCLIVLATSVESMNVTWRAILSLISIVVCSTNPGSSVNGTDRSLTNTVNFGSWRNRAAKTSRILSAEARFRSNLALSFVPWSLRSLELSLRNTNGSSPLEVATMNRRASPSLHVSTS